MSPDPEGGGGGDIIQLLPFANLNIGNLISQILLQLGALSKLE